MIPSAVQNGPVVEGLLSSTSPPYGAEGTAAASARAYVRAVLTGWRMHRVVDDAELVTGELAANAVKASCTASGEPLYVCGRMPLVGVCLVTDGADLQIECWDQAPGEPVVKDIDYATAQSGRGLNMIIALTGDRWGWNRKPGRHGKRVWALLEVPPEGASPGGAGTERPA